MTDFFKEMLRSERKTSPNYVFGHPVWTGTQWLPVFSYSSTDKRIQGVDVPAEVIEPGPRVDVRNLIVKIHQLAPQVAAAYGDDAVGDLPALPKRKKARRAA